MTDIHKSSAGIGSDKRDTVLEVKDLRVHYATPEGDVIAANGVSFDIHKGELLGLVHAAILERRYDSQSED